MHEAKRISTVGRRALLGALSLPLLVRNAAAVGLHRLDLVGNSDVAPKSWLDGTGAPRGYAVEAVLSILASAGIAPNLRLHPWRRAIEVSRRGQALLLSVFFSVEREAEFLFSYAYAYDEVVLVVRRGEAFTYRGAEDLRGRRVAYQAGAVYGTGWAEHQRVIVPVEDNAPTGRLKMLAAGFVDAAVLNPGAAALRHQAAQAGLSPDLFEVLPRPLAQLPLHIGVPKAMNRPDLLLPINKAILALRADGTLAAIEANYFPEGGRLGRD